MIPAGYMAKRVALRPQWLSAPEIHDIYSVSSCISKNFADYIDDWRHNGFWFFDTPSIIEELCRKHGIDRDETMLFYYEVHEQQYVAGTGTWESFTPTPGLPVRVTPPVSCTLGGYDVATFWSGNAPECSPLSCNGLAAEIPANRHCLLDSLETALHLLEHGRFDNSEPCPFRIFSVYTL